MSIINRHNYETFFLLYADNELSVAEIKLVDDFVLTNPDLQEELVMLQQSILKPDNIVFDDKKSLLKNEFNPSGVQEKLLLYLDNELTAAERNEIDELIKVNTDFEKEFNILQQTKLLPGNTIVFEDKRTLYHKETGRLMAYPWWRMAVAAVFIGVSVWGGLVFFDNDSKSNPNETVKNIAANIAPDSVRPFVYQTITPSSSVESKAINKSQGSTIKYFKDTHIQSPKIVASQSLAAKKQNIAVNEKDNNLPKPYLENVNNSGSNKNIIAYVTPEQQLNNIVTTGNNEIYKNKDQQPPANQYAATTSFIDNSEENQNRVLFMDEERIKKTKLGGIFRKVKRVIERSANIKPGSNNIKVANLEFTIQ